MKKVKMKNVFVALTFSFLLLGCVSNVPYQSTSRMSVKEASITIEKLNNKMDRHGSIKINEDAIQFTYIGKIQRFDFNSIERVEIYKKHGNVMVYIEGLEESGYVYRAYSDDTRADSMEMSGSIKTAKLYVDSVESLIFAYKSKHNIPINTPQAVSGSNVEKLTELLSLKEKGLISDTEYQQKRKHVLDGI